MLPSRLLRTCKLILPKREYSTGVKQNTLFFTRLGHESDLGRELRALATPLKITCSQHSGFVEAKGHEGPLDPAWAWQSMPSVISITQEGVGKLAKLAAKRLIETMKNQRIRRWAMHAIRSSVQTSHKSYGSVLTGNLDSFAASPGTNYQSRVKLIEAAIIEDLKRDCKPLRWLRPLPFEEGYIHIPHEKKYPAESYRKLKEILHLMRLHEPNSLEGKSSVELGSHPGGWTYVLLERGSKVYAVDWAKMKEPYVVEHPNFHETVGDGRTFEPSMVGLDRVDYLWTDMALPPPRSIATLERWVANRWTCKFAWTLKFNFIESGPKIEPVAILEEARAMLAKYPYCQYFMRHLHNHYNEIVIIGDVMGEEAHQQALNTTTHHQQPPKKSTTESTTV